MSVRIHSEEQDCRRDMYTCGFVTYVTCASGGLAWSCSKELPAFLMLELVSSGQEGGAGGGRLAESGGQRGQAGAHKDVQKP